MHSKCEGRLFFFPIIVIIIEFFWTCPCLDFVGNPSQSVWHPPDTHDQCSSQPSTASSPPAPSPSSNTSIPTPHNSCPAMAQGPVAHCSSAAPSLPPIPKGQSDWPGGFLRRSSAALLSGLALLLPPPSPLPPSPTRSHLPPPGSNWWRRQLVVHSPLSPPLCNPPPLPPPPPPSPLSTMPRQQLVAQE